MDKIWGLSDHDFHMMLLVHAFFERDFPAFLIVDYFVVVAQQRIYLPQYYYQRIPLIY
jgi:hypothetical protein